VISPLQFFAIAPLHSPYMLTALAVVLLSGSATLIVDPTRGANAMAPLVLVQMFAASSGFAVAARRGHFDLLLTGGAGRLRIALAHLGLSVMPGLLVWCVIALVEIGVAGSSAPRALASGTVVSMVVVSALAWALTVRLPRLSGGFAWLVGIAVWLLGWSSDPLAPPVGHDAADLVTRALIVTLCPFLLLGQRLSRADLLVVTPTIALAALLTTAAVAWIVRMDAPLESAQ
jgi:hypothetical protein